MLDPETSPLYSYNLKEANASINRGIGSAIPENSRLKIAYRKYINRDQSSSNQKLNLNLVFVHGTGMNKGLWHYHIDKLFNSCQGNKQYMLNTVLALDCVNHGDSAYLNKDNLGYSYNWRDSSKDIIDLVINNEAEAFINCKSSVNVLVGHSMGGFICLYASLLSSNLFDSCVTINPVCYTHKNLSKELKQIYHKWYERGYMKDTFEIKNEDKWYDEVREFFETRSFFTKFNPVVLKNMLQDEIIEVNQANCNEVHLKTTVQSQMNTYMNGSASIDPVMQLMQYIEIPVYRILSQFDTTSEESIATTANALKKTLVQVDLPNEKHLVNAENPDLIVRKLNEIIEQRMAANIDKDSINSKYLAEKYGGNYREVMPSIFYKHLLENGVNIPKL